MENNMIATRSYFCFLISYYLLLLPACGVDTLWLRLYLTAEDMFSFIH